MLTLWLMAVLWGSSTFMSLNDFRKAFILPTAAVVLSSAFSPNTHPDYMASSRWVKWSGQTSVRTIKRDSHSNSKIWYLLTYLFSCGAVLCSAELLYWLVHLLLPAFLRRRQMLNYLGWLMLPANESLWNFKLFNWWTWSIILMIHFFKQIFMFVAFTSRL